MFKDYRLQIFCAFLGALAGYLLLHPYAMVIFVLTAGDRSAEPVRDWTTLNDMAVSTFSPFMLPMSIAFAIFGGIIGFLVGAVIERKRKLNALAYENEKNKVALEAVKSLMVTLSHYLLNANMIIGGRVRRCRKATTDEELLSALAVIEEQGRKIDAVIGSLRRVTEIKVASYTTDGRVTMLDIAQEVENELKGSTHGLEREEAVK